MQRHVLPPNPSRLIEGLRDTGYDFNTALADVIDNSVDALATVISIRIDMDHDGEIVVSVADNGCGMNRAALLNGMTYGAPGKPDPRRLGKFGLGLKTASTAFCRRLSVISRDGGGAMPTKAVWDLDHVESVGEWELLIDSPSKEEESLLNRVAQDSSGTLVIWEKVDRLLKTYNNPSGSHARNALDKVTKSFREHAAAIYQRFLDPDDRRARTLVMTLIGEAIRAWSPFCEEEPQTELVSDEVVPVELPNGETSSFRIRAFVLPRKEQFSSPEAIKQARIANKNQGMYIYREGRLIHEADWLGMFAKEPHLTLLRVEFSFDHTLDVAFHVDIKKSRILLNDDLYDWIQNTFLPAPRNAANERSRKGQRKAVDDQARSAHLDSNSNIAMKEQDLAMANITVVDAGRGEVQINNKKGAVRLRLRITQASANGQVNVQTADGLDDGVLWEPALIDGHHAVRINTGHPYYHKVYVPNHASGVTIQGMDALLWALVEAELGTVSESTKSHMQELRFEVSRLLRRLVDDLPEPEVDEKDS